MLPFFEAVSTGELTCSMWAWSSSITALLPTHGWHHFPCDITANATIWQKTCLIILRLLQQGLWIHLSLVHPTQRKWKCAWAAPRPVGSSPVQSTISISHRGPGTGSSGSCLQCRALPGWWHCRNQTLCWGGRWPRVGRTGGQHPPLEEAKTKRGSERRRSECARLIFSPTFTNVT